MMDYNRHQYRVIESVYRRGCSEEKYFRMIRQLLQNLSDKET